MRPELDRLRAEVARAGPGEPGPVLALAEALERAGATGEALGVLLAAEASGGPEVAARLAGFPRRGAGAAGWAIRVADFLPELFSGTRAVLVVAFSPDGRQLAVGHANGSVRVGPVGGTGRDALFHGHGKGCSALAFSADGDRLASGGGDGTSSERSLVDGARLLARGEGRRGRIVDVWLGGRGLWAAGRKGGTRPGEEALAEAIRAAWEGLGGPDRGATVFAPGRRLVLLAGAAGTVLLDHRGERLYRGRALPLRAVRGLSEGQVPARALSPDGELLVLGSSPAATARAAAGGRAGALAIPVREPERAVELVKFEVVSAVGFSFLGDRLALGTSTGRVLLAEERQPPARAVAKGAAVGAACEREDTPGLTLGQVERLWSEVPAFAQPRRWTRATAEWILVGAGHLWVRSKDGCWRRIEPGTRKVAVVAGIGEIPPEACRAEHPELPERAEAGSDLGRCQAGLAAFEGREELLGGLGIPDGRAWLAPGGDFVLAGTPLHDGSPRAWLVRRQGPGAQALEAPAPITCAAFSPRGTRVGVGYADQSLRVFGVRRASRRAR